MSRKELFGGLILIFGLIFCPFSKAILAFDTSPKAENNQVDSLTDGFQVDSRDKPSESRSEKSDDSKTGMGSGTASEYTVVSGDSLWKIAQNFLGDGSRYFELVEANKTKYPSLVKNPNLIYPGWVLTIPGGTGKPQVAGKSTAGDQAPKESTTGKTTPPTGNLQQRIVQEASKLVNKRNFPYAPATKGGRLGCAQVVTTALVAAGAAPSIRLGVGQVLSDLRARGWKEVAVPPFAAGDVITWPTYDFNGDGRIDNDTHIGIIMQSGNSVQAMSNSSSQRMPRLHSPYYVGKISRVLRKA